MQEKKIHYEIQDLTLKDKGVDLLWSNTVWLGAGGFSLTMAFISPPFVPFFAASLSPGLLPLFTALPFIVAGLYIASTLVKIFTEYQEVKRRNKLLDDYESNQKTTMIETKTLGKLDNLQKALYVAAAVTSLLIISSTFYLGIFALPLTSTTILPTMLHLFLDIIGIKIASSYIQDFFKKTEPDINLQGLINIVNNNPHSTLAPSSESHKKIVSHTFYQNLQETLFSNNVRIRGIVNDETQLKAYKDQVLPDHSFRDKIAQQKLVNKQMAITQLKQ